MSWIIIGSLAACLTMLAFVPQIFKVIKTRSVADVSVIMLLQLGVGVVLWVMYGLHLKDAVIITANTVTFLCIAVLLVLYFRYGRKIQ